MELHQFIGGGQSATSLTRQCEEEARHLVTRFIGKAAVPEKILERAVLEVGADLYHRQRARLGVVGLDSGEVQPVRVRADPMAAAYPLLTPYVGLGIG